MNEKAHAVPRVRRVAAIHVCALCALPFVRVALSRVARSIREDTERRAGERVLVAVIEGWHVSQLRKALGGRSWPEVPMAPRLSLRRWVALTIEATKC